jgi:WD40 repeat protein
MTVAREWHTATLLPSGEVLIVGGVNYSVGVVESSAELYDSGAGTFAATGSMTVARVYHTATLLQNGMVLIAGGGPDSSADGAVASAELYDPGTGSFVVTGSMTIPRHYHTATLLQSGKVLIAGGGPCDATDEGTCNASAEIYDPNAGTFSATGFMASVRLFHSATSLPGGEVLVAGGSVPPRVLGALPSVGSTQVAMAELYNSGTGSFSPTGSLNAPSDRHTATLLPNGMVLIAGGGPGSLSSAELYNPSTGTFTVTGSMTPERSEHTATLLPSGEVLIAGGADDRGNSLASAELYDPETGIFAATVGMSVARQIHTATLLPNGKVLIAGGEDNLGSGTLASAELYNE